MKKILSLITVIFIILTVFGAHAKNTTIGGGLTTPSQGTSSTVTGGIGGSLTPPGGSLAPVQPSADNGKNNRPSPEWLSALDSPMIADLVAMSTDPCMMELWGISERFYTQLDPAAEYDPLPAIIMYGPDRAPLIMQAIMGNDTTEFYSSILTAIMSSAMSSEEFAMTAAINLIDYQPTDTKYVYTAAFYTSSSEPESNPILAVHTWEDGISTVTARFVTADALRFITEEENENVWALNRLGMDVFWADSIFPEFNASIEAPAGTEMAVADDGWLTETAFILAEQIVNIASDPDYISMYTDSAVVIDTCREFSEFDIASAEVVSIQPFESENMLNHLAVSNDSECPELLAKYFGPKVGSLIRINKISNSGSKIVAAATVCKANDNYYAEGDFTSCNVTLSCGGKYNIVVSFGNYGNGIIIADAMFVPAE